MWMTHGFALVYRVRAHCHDFSRSLWLPKVSFYGYIRLFRVSLLRMFKALLLSVGLFC